MNIFMGSRDNYSFMTIMALPNEWLALFDFKESLKAQNTTSWNTPHMTTECTLAADSFKVGFHIGINLVVIELKE